MSWIERKLIKLMLAFKLCRSMQKRLRINKNKVAISELRLAILI